MGNRSIQIYGMILQFPKTAGDMDSQGWLIPFVYVGVDLLNALILKI